MFGPTAWAISRRPLSPHPLINRGDLSEPLATYPRRRWLCPEEAHIDVKVDVGT